MWSTLEQTGVNDLIHPFGIQFGAESPDSLAGGHTKAGPITEKRLKISYQREDGLRLPSMTGLMPIPSAHSRK